MGEMAPHIVADVGGTNARFAMVAPDRTDIYNFESLKVRDFCHIADAVHHYMASQGLQSLDQACIALAGPVEGDQVQLTNGDWSFSIRQTQESLGLSRLVVVNDFKAQAAAIPFIRHDQLLELGGKDVADGFKLVIGPGTGLGVAATLKTGGDYLIVEGEGGHIGLSPANDRELAVHRALLGQYGRVSAERIVCGSGLRNLYRTLLSLDGHADAELPEAEVVARALSGEDPKCCEALDMFLAYLGAVAGDLALTFRAKGGVYIAGGIMPRVKDYVSRSQFRARFEAKGRLAHLVRNIPTFLVLSQEAGLTGAAACLRNSRGG